MNLFKIIITLIIVSLREYKQQKIRYLCNIAGKGDCDRFQYKSTGEIIEGLQICIANFIIEKVTDNSGIETILNTRKFVLRQNENDYFFIKSPTNNPSTRLTYDEKTNCFLNNTEYEEFDANVDIFSIIGKYNESKFDDLEKPHGCDECDSINEIWFSIRQKNISTKSEIENKLNKEKKTKYFFDKFEVKNIMEGFNRLLI